MHPFGATGRGLRVWTMSLYEYFRARRRFPAWGAVFPFSLQLAAILTVHLAALVVIARDFAGFVARLERDFPAEPFLLVRFGDHQPEFSERILEPGLDEKNVAQRIEAHDPRYFTTSYAIDTINFAPVDLTSALDTLEAPYLPLVIQEAAGLPLDPSFVEQSKILRRCRGAFYLCNGGAEARRFNRLLIDAGLIKNL
jgi:hypothetical protein